MEVVEKQERGEGTGAVVAEETEVVAKARRRHGLPPVRWTV
jgi:hypothetical protein